MSAPVDVLAVNTAHLREIARSNSHTAKTNALLNAANEIDRLRASLIGLTAAAKAAQTSLQHMCGPESIIHARTAELDIALDRVKGDAP